MKKRWISVAAIAFTVALRPAAAQQFNSPNAGWIGGLLQFPAAIGASWHVTNDMAIRPEMSFSTLSQTSSTSSFTIDVNGWAAAVSAPLYMSDRDNIRTYVSPRLGYSKSTAKSVSGATSTSSTQTQITFAGSYGVQYAPIKRLNIFAETGVQYTNQKTASSTSTVTSSGFSLRSAIGVILYHVPSK